VKLICHEIHMFARTAYKFREDLFSRIQAFQKFREFGQNSRKFIHLKYERGINCDIICKYKFLTVKNVFVCNYHVDKTMKIKNKITFFNIIRLSCK